MTEHRLQGIWLLLARTAWLSITLLILTLFVIGIPSEYGNHLQTAVRDFQPHLDRLGQSAAFYAIYRTVLDTLVALAFLALGVILFVHKSNDWMVLLVSVANMAFGSLFVPTLLQIIKLQPEWTAPVGFLRALGLGSSLIVLYYIFPDGRFVPRWSKWLGIGWALLAVIWFLVPQFPANLVYMDSWQKNMTLSYATFLFSYGTGIAAQLYRYQRVSNPIRRQQTKWVVFGTTTAFLGFVLYHIPLVFFKEFSQPTYVRLLHIYFGIPLYHMMILMAPLTITFSIFRYRLWDIDRVIKRSLMSVALSATIGLIYYALVVLVGLVLTSITGSQHTTFVTMISTLAVAMLFNPIRRRLQMIIDRRFYRKKVDMVRTMETFSGMMRNEVDLRKLTSQLTYVVTDTMHPIHTSVWLTQKAVPPPSPYMTNTIRLIQEQQGDD